MTLCEEFPGDVRLQSPVIYAIPRELLELIDQHAPRLLTAADLHFERRLRELAVTGFRDQTAFGCELLDEPQQHPESREVFGAPQDRALRSARLAMQESFAPSQGSNSSSCGELRQPDAKELCPPPSQVTIGLAAERQQLQQRVNQRLRGFAGWLVTNPDYHREMVNLEQTWRTWSDVLPQTPDSAALASSPPKGLSGPKLSALSRLRRRAMDFLARWNLLRLETWDIPIPVSPVLFTGDVLPRNELQAQGISLFIPWSLLADRDLKVDEVVAYHRQRQELGALTEWMKGRHPKEWGVDRYAKLFLLYVYLERAIRPRYGDRLRGHVGQLDLAFREYFGPPPRDNEDVVRGAEAVRRIREMLQKKLRFVDGRREDAGEA
ncbi:MAG TPA: hypothetical protein VM165_07720 [Planctomycetaceae bacterium]|nr:hypothetical protein [Planctomycetaceae bacterium]